MKYDHHYLIGIQFLGFRYNGWQQQPNRKTVEGMLLKTFEFIWPDRKFKILGAGRTDAKVSALNSVFELFLNGTPVKGEEVLLDLLNVNLPSDIKCIKVQKVNKEFNIIKDAKWKEYIYLFSFGNKNHPFCAPFMANIIEDLDIVSMHSAARLFEGTHDFSNYTTKDKVAKETSRTVLSCQIMENTLLKANFFPKKSYALHISSKGFMRYQVRMIMGALIQVGRGVLDESEIKASLISGSFLDLKYIAPGSGLLLNNSEFETVED